MRGKEGEKVLVIDQERITPAYAGKRLPPLDAASLSRDHPRICGEKYIYESNKAVATRITPAYAGKSEATARDMSETKDHPRICGEKTKKIP